MLFITLRHKHENTMYNSFASKQHINKTRPQLRTEGSGNNPHPVAFGILCGQDNTDLVKPLRMNAHKKVLYKIFKKLEVVGGGI